MTTNLSFLTHKKPRVECET